MTDLFVGHQGNVYYASLNIIVVTLLLLLSVQLLIHRRKRAYLTLALCMAIMLIGQVVLLVAGLAKVGGGSGLAYMINILNASSFILANMGIYQLYGETSKLLIRSVLGLLALAVITPIFPVAAGIYQALLIGLAYYAVNPLLTSKRKYTVALGLIAIATVAHITNAFMEQPVPALYAIDNLLRVGFYAAVFVILLDRVIDLMDNIYNRSTRDPLTGLFNRFYFYTTVSYMVNEKAPISIIFFDLDNFKKLNDTQGHEEGDKALKMVASILREEEEEVGIAGRYGGEEMVMMIEDPEVDVDELAEKIRYRIESETVVTASIGHATYEPGLSTEQLIKNADMAMYKAKKTGKNKVVSYKSLLPEQALESEITQQESANAALQA